MDFAKDLRTGAIVGAEGARRSKAYVCPRPGCGGSVYLAQGDVQRAHFRHYPGEGTAACDQYFPGTGPLGGVDTSAVAAVVEDLPTELGLLVEHTDNRWGLAIRVPEIPNSELGEASLQTIGKAFIDVFAGNLLLGRASALDVRPGIGSARVTVPPALQPYRSQPSGDWPSGISQERWRRTARAMATFGTLFRQHDGEWVRLREGSSVHWGEDLVLVADKLSPPPGNIVIEAVGHLHGAGIQWVIHHLHLPETALAAAETWLDRLGHQVTERPWGVCLASPARGYGEQGDPIFWIGDTAVLEVEGPAPRAECLAVLGSGTNSQSASFRVGKDRRQCVGVSSHAPGGVRFTVRTQDQRVDFQVVFERRPEETALQRLLEETPRLRVLLGDTSLEAWRDQNSPLPLFDRHLRSVRLDAGVAGVRFTVTAWTDGKRRTLSQVWLREAEMSIASALPTASKLQVEAENLGLIEMEVAPARPVSRSASLDRLARWERVVALIPSKAAPTSPAFVRLPSRADVFLPQTLGTADLIRGRLHTWRQRQLEGNGS